MSIEYWNGIRTKVGEAYNINEDNKDLPSIVRNRVLDFKEIGETTYNLADDAIDCEKLLIDYNKFIQDEQEYVINDSSLQDAIYADALERMHLQMELWKGNITQEEYDQKLEELDSINLDTNSSIKKEAAEESANSLISNSEKLSSAVSGKLGKIVVEMAKVDLDFSGIASQGKSMGNLLLKKISSVTN